MTSEFIGPASALIGRGSYICQVLACGTEVFTDGRILIEISKEYVQSCPVLPLSTQPMANLVMKGSYNVSLDPQTCMEVFEGSYIDNEYGRVSVKCRVKGVQMVPSNMKQPDGSVELSNGVGIAPSRNA